MFDEDVEDNEISAVDRLREKVNEAEEKKRIEPPSRAPRKTRNILRVEHLTSKKGIVALPEMLKDANFKGSGREVDDLRVLLFKAKHWAHRLHPALTFEDFIEKAEQLGSKRPVKNFLDKIRHNQPLFLEPDEILAQSDGEDEVKDNNNEEAMPEISASDLFDNLLK